MNAGFFVKGLILGFSIAAPVGPIGLLCINKTLTRGKLSGFLSGMGAATADMVYGSIAAFGLTAVARFLTSYSLEIKTVGGLFLVYLGIRTFLAKNSKNSLENKSNSLIKDYFSTFFLTLTNPMTIISFAAVFAGMGLVSQNHDFLNAIFLISGVFTGSALWWLILSQGVNIFSNPQNDKFLNIINKISGIILFVFGIFAMLS